LGFRTERDALEAQRREVQQLRFTSLDRIIQRSQGEDENYFSVRREPVEPWRRYAKAQDHYVLARLAKLELIGLTRLPLQITQFSTISLLEGRVLGHGHEESTGRPYLLLEGVEGKIHFLWQNADIQAARRQGHLRVNSFVRMEKQFASTRPFLRIEDLGDSRKLLQNDAYFRKTVLRLLRNRVGGIEPSWSGWLGEYQKRLLTHFIAMRDHEEQHPRELARGR
jgi:hypothetical protein